MNKQLTVAVIVSILEFFVRNVSLHGPIYSHWNYLNIW